jgi:hypothetical protein
MIGDGGAIGWLVPETIEFPDDAQPTLAYTSIQYTASQASRESVNLAWDTSWTQAEVRSAAKDAIRADVIEKLGIAIPKTRIKMLNSPE